MARVLVTGANGFIGSKLARRLVERGDDVTCLVRPNSNTQSLATLAVRRASGDVRDPQAIYSAVRDADIVYHLAGLVTAFTADELLQVNAQGVGNVATACAKLQSPPVLVSISSLAAAGPSPADRPRVECDPPAPVSNYGRAKRAGELEAEKFAARLPITIIRPPIVFGEGDSLMRPVFRSIYRHSFHAAFGVALSHYALVHVADLVNAIILSAERGSRLAPLSADDTSGACPARGYYFVAGDEQPTFAELGVLIGQSMGIDRVRVWGSNRTAFLWPAAAVAEAIARARRRPYIFNFDKVREARAGNWTCSTDTIRRELDFVPQASLADRLHQTSDWYRKHNWL